jgi:hypothetical protein
MPFQSQQSTIDAVFHMVSGKPKEGPPATATASSDDKIITGPPMKRRRNTVGGDTTPTTPVAATKGSDAPVPASVGTAKRSSKRRR